MTAIRAGDGVPAIHQTHRRAGDEAVPLPLAATP
jgi:hypothetical protein